MSMQKPQTEVLLDPAGLAEPAALSKCRGENDAGMMDPAVLEDGRA
jgi:hypothetical protein